MSLFLASCILAREGRRGCQAQQHYRTYDYFLHDLFSVRLTFNARPLTFELNLAGWTAKPGRHNRTNTALPVQSTATTAPTSRRPLTIDALATPLPCSQLFR